MSGDPYDVQGEVRDALNTAVDSYGKRVLNDPRVLGNLVTDLLPDLPRERSLLIAAAEAGIAGELTRNVEEQHMDADTAVALAARSLAENRSLEPGASTWVATEYAKALGYQVRTQAAPPWSSATSDPAPPNNQLPPHQPTQTTNQPVGPWLPTPPPPAPWAPTPTPNPGPQAPVSVPPGPTRQEMPAPNQWQPMPAPGPNQWQPGPAPAPNQWQPTPPPGAGQWQQPPAPGGPGPWPPAGGAGQWPPAGGQGSNQGSGKSRRGLFIGGGIGAAVIVIVVILVLALSGGKPTSTNASGGSSKSPSPHPTVSKSPSPSPTDTSPAPTPSPTPTLASLPAGVKALKVLLPYDIQDADTDCSEQAKIPWTNPGLVKGLACTLTDVPGGFLYAYQLDSTANYLQAWANYNTWAKFGTSDTLDCPPGSGDAQGGPGEWWGPRFAKRSGQVLECFTSSTNDPVYVWTYPTENAFLMISAPKSWTFSKLETWWENNAV